MTKHHPHTHLGLCFKDFAIWMRNNESCVGLNVAGFATGKVLKEHGYDVSVFPVRNNVDIVTAINKEIKAGNPLTHLVISAPWLSVYDLTALLKAYPTVKFVILSHSNVGFLQADANGVSLLRAYALLSNTYPNLIVGGNSLEFVEWFSEAYDYRSILLPNLYPITEPKSSVDYKIKRWKRAHKSPVIKIGVFGAARPYKNFMTAVAGAILIHKSLGVPVEIHMSDGGETDTFGINKSIAAMTEGVPGVRVIKHSWVYWDKFINLIGQMDLLINVSYTESFNMITADGIYAGVPSVISPAIAWGPESWMAEPDSVIQVSEVGVKLLTEHSHAEAGVKALIAYNHRSLEFWKDFLRNHPREE